MHPLRLLRGLLPRILPENLLNAGEMMTLGRILALDIGDKNIGAAISDALGITAQGLDVLRRGPKGEELSRLGEIVEEYGVAEIVVGLPLNMDGSEGPRARDARAYARRLSRALAVPVRTWDERLTTAEARRTLLDADLSRAKRKKVIDKLAAVLILESYLQSRGRHAEN